MREESVDWLVKSAEAGNQVAMSFLSVKYEGGMGGGMGSRSEAGSEESIRVE